MRVFAADGFVQEQFHPAQIWMRNIVRPIGDFLAFTGDKQQRESRTSQMSRPAFIGRMWVLLGGRQDQRRSVLFGGMTRPGDHELVADQLLKMSMLKISHVFCFDSVGTAS